MELIEEAYGWRTDDASTLLFRRGPHRDFWQERPAILLARRFGHPGLVLPETVPLRPEELEFVRVARAQGRVREDRLAPWGSSVVASVYVRRPRIGSAAIVLAQMGGLGPRFGVLDQLDADLTLLPMIRAIEEPALWDLVDAFFGTWERGAETERRRWRTAVIEKRVRTRRRRGQVYVEIEASAEEPAHADTTHLPA